MPLVTGAWNTLPEEAFLEQHPVSGPLHFAGTSLYIDPITQVVGTQTAQEIIAAQAAQFGWPLHGIYISASGGGGLPHVCLHRTQFPPQTGAVSQRADKLQTQLDEAFRLLYEEPIEGSRTNWVRCHFWNYRADPNLYTPRGGGVGDYAVYISQDDPPANWWQGIQ